MTVGTRGGMSVDSALYVPGCRRAGVSRNGNDMEYYSWNQRYFIKKIWH